MYHTKNKTIADQYDIYYTGGANSLYNRRFESKPRATMREQELLISHLESAIKFASGTIIRIMDFGCGNGRTMPVLYEYAFLCEGYKFEIVAYDISIVGLNELSDLLVIEGFQLVGDVLENSWYLEKNNVTVKVCLGSTESSIAELEQLFGAEFNLVLSIFGTLSHIPWSACRLKIIQMLKNIACTNGILLLSLPSYASEKAALQQFDEFRQSNNMPDIFHLAQENGDVYYKIKGSNNLYNFYHLYRIEEAIEQLQTIQIANLSVGIYSTFSIPQICQNKLYMISDYVLSKIFSLPILRGTALMHFATNFFISAKIERLSMNCFSTPPVLEKDKDVSEAGYSRNQALFRGSMAINLDGHLEIGGVDMVKLANSYQYPIYVIDEMLVRKNMHDYVTSIKKYYSNPGGIFYASKALMNLGLCKIAQQEGMGLDVSTEGELYTAIQAGFPMQHVIMHGNNKSEEEVELALKSGVGIMVVDNLNDIMLISEIGKKLNKVTNVLVRVKPGIYAHTHSHIATGSNESKFGFIIENNAAEEAIAKILDHPNLKFDGIHLHIGSQILDITDYTKAIDLATAFIKKLHDKKIVINELNLGGGLGVSYTCKDNKIKIEDFVKTISQHLTEKLTEQNLPLPKLMFEPGRSIVGEAGTTIYKIGSTKTSNDQTYVAVNGGMSDNIRPALYQVKYHAVIANKMHEIPIIDSKIVGKSCESGDVLIEQILLPRSNRGDILAIFSTGAYNYSMASNYNRLPIPGMVLVRDGVVEWIVKAQTLQDIIRDDLLPQRFK